MGGKSNMNEGDEKCTTVGRKIWR